MLLMLLNLKRRTVDLINHHESATGKASYRRIYHYRILMTTSFDKIISIEK